MNQNSASDSTRQPFDKKWEQQFQKQINVCTYGCRELRERLGADNGNDRYEQVHQYCQFGEDGQKELYDNRAALNAGIPGTAKKIGENIFTWGNTCRKLKTRLEQELNVDQAIGDTKRKWRLLIALLVFLVVFTGAYLLWKYVA